MHSSYTSIVVTTYLVVLYSSVVKLSKVEGGGVKKIILILLCLHFFVIARTWPLRFSFNSYDVGGLP